MNPTYRIVWNQVLNAWVTVSLSLTAVVAQAAPQGGEVAAGTGSISQAGNTTTITQTSQNLSLNWQSFNIARQETVNFVQPSASAIAVNRIFDTNGSQILGQLNANGQVYLVNPNGILFGQGAQVNVGSLVASTLDVNDASLNSATRSFSGTGTGSIVNQGTISAASGGYVALLGNTVSNQGTITAPLGTVALGAGNAVTLNFNGNSLVKMQVDQSVLNSLAENGGVIQADGGMVRMSAGAKDALLASVVNNTGVIEARTVENHEGSIILLGGMAAGTTHVGGTLDASAPNGGNGGFIETSAAHVKIAADTKITTASAAGAAGHWLIDPVDFTIATTGGDITGTALGNLLADNSITIQTTSGTAGTNGDIFVNDAVSWSANNTLTLDAYRNININQSISATGTSGKLALKYGQGSSDGVIATVASSYNVNAAVNLSAGQNFSTQLGSAGSVKDYTVITSLGAAGSTTAADLQGMNGNLNANYVLGGNIDAAATSGWNSGSGFTPIGVNYNTPFRGTFDGLGHTISTISINRPTTNYVGLFGYTSAGTVIRNVGLVGGSVTGMGWVGALVGDDSGTIGNSYSTASVTGINSYIGGLVGAKHYSGGNKTLSNSYSTGSVSGGSYVGGLVGFNDLGTITNSYATGSVSGRSSVGGLIGGNYVAPGNFGKLSYSFATGRVTGSGTKIGSLIGENLNTGTVVDNFWDSTVNPTLAGIASGTATGATGLTTVQMRTASNFTGFNFTSTPGATGNNWVMVDADGSLNNAGGSLGSTRPMLASEYSTTINNAHQLQLMVMAPAASYTLGTNVNAAATGPIGGISTDVWGNAGFVPIGNAGAKFSGTFDGLGHTIVGLYINSSSNNAALFGYTSSAATIRNLGLVGGSVNSTGYVIGFLVGSNAGAVRNSYATGSVNGRGLVGGLVGINSGGAIDSSYATGNVQGADGSIGGLVGQSSSITSSINNSYATGNVSGSYTVGGLLGDNNSGSVSNSYATGNVAVKLAPTGSRSRFGGLMGYNSGTIDNSYATGNVNGDIVVGGLVGHNDSGTISNSYAAGTVFGFTKIGGLVGWNMAGSSPLLNATITNSYASGSVVGTGDQVGGLVGLNQGGYGSADGGGTASIRNAYATGTVTGGNYVGGLVGLNTGGQGGNGSSDTGGSASITNAYATGPVTGGNYIGGLVGSNADGTAGSGDDGPGGAGGLASISNGFWNTTTSTRTTGVDASELQTGVTGLTTSEMMQRASFSSWNTVAPNSIANIGGSGAVWRIYEGYTAPLLTRFMTAVVLADTSVTYNGTAQTGATTALNSTSVTRATGTNVGVYNNAYSTQQGYDISGGTLTINAAASLVYSATPPASVLNATTQLASIAASPQTIVQPTVLSLSPAITVTQTNTGPTSKPDDLATVNTTMTIGGTGPSLQIVNGGIRLPGTLVSANE